MLIHAKEEEYEMTLFKHTYTFNLNHFHFPIGNRQLRSRICIPDYNPSVLVTTGAWRKKIQFDFGLLSQWQTIDGKQII